MKVARFQASTTPGYCTMGLGAASVYEFQADFYVTTDVLGAPASGSFIVIPHADDDEIFAEPVGGGVWRFTTDGTVVDQGTFVAGTVFTVKAVCTFVSGTLWDIEWFVDGVSLGTNSGIDLGTDDVSGIDVDFGARFTPTGHSITTYMSNVIIKQDGVMTRQDQFGTDDFSLWSAGSTGEADVIEDPTGQFVPREGGGTGVPGGVAKFSATISPYDDAYVKVSLSPSAHYVITAVMGIKAADLHNSFDLIEIGDFAANNATGIYAASSTSQFQTYFSPGDVGAIPLNQWFTIEAEVTHVSGTTWDVAWSVNGVLLFTDSGATFTNDESQPLPLVVGCRFGGSGDSVHYCKSVVVTD